MKVKAYNIKPFTGKFDIVKQEKHYEDETEKFFSNLNKLIIIRLFLLNNLY
jgi:hypothetical protein